MCSVVLHVYITVRTANRADVVLNGQPRRDESKINVVFKGGIGAGRAVIESNGPADLESSSGDVLVLPDPPGPVDLSVM